MKSRKRTYFKYFSLFFTIAVLVFIAGCSGAPPSTPNIGQIAYNTDTGIDYDTIQKAIDAAGSGETIIVYSGIYEEKIKFNNKNITVRSADPSDPDIVAATVIDGGGSGTVVQFVSGDESTLEGFTIRNGNSGGYGGGIFILSSDPTITDNTITDNTAHLKGGGIFISFGDPTITGNTITGNTVTTEDGGGIFMSNSNPTITGNTINDNQAVVGGGIYVDNNSSPAITGNTITYNQVLGGGGGGIIVNNNSSPTITGNTIEYNMAEGGGGIFILSSDPVITGNTITYNQAGGGGGIFMSNSNPAITGNTITYNQALGGGGGIYVDNNSSPAITGNIITYNQAGYLGGGGILVYPNSNLQPDDFRPAGWGTSRENIPTGATLDPAEGEEYTIAGNEFLGNEHGTSLDYTEGAHVYFK
jgi:parallel beta-helix repeat protein